MLVKDPNSRAEVGKAGRHFRQGAKISYSGVEIDVRFLSPVCMCADQPEKIPEYEVLVEASTPVRWSYQPQYSAPPYPASEKSDESYELPLTPGAPPDLERDLK